ncbi:hypothetical protein LCGC14_1633110 [marine sediment metagenome]|uniref:Uncharacterized protein n=1 Tax=marine sediment metagenome TaxID=412755 RepID=A0A0F9IPB1_9ZZZZ
MFKELNQIYHIGEDLGLTRKEINRSFFFKEEANRLRNRIIFHIIMLIIVAIIGFTLILLAPSVTKDTYSASGARYSTVKIGDFKKKFKI